MADGRRIKFLLAGCDISFHAEAPADMTVEQLIKQANRIIPYWCDCGVHSSEYDHPTEIIFDYDDVQKTSDNIPCTIKRFNGGNQK